MQSDAHSNENHAANKGLYLAILRDYRPLRSDISAAYSDVVHIMY
jgi:hypothetical protein